MTPESLRNVIKCSLRPLNKWSPAAEELLMMISAHESGLGENLRQIGGPARGLYQMEPDTESDMWATYLSYRKGLVEQLVSATGVSGPDPNHLQYNPIYSTIIARLKLGRVPESLPAAHDVDGMAKYAKKYWNSPKGKATPEKYAADYLRLVRPV